MCKERIILDIRNWHSTDAYGTRRQGRHKKRWIDMVNDNCKQRDLDIHQAT